MWEQDSVILDQSDLPGDVLEDIYQPRDFSGFTGNDSICFLQLNQYILYVIPTTSKLDLRNTIGDLKQPETRLEIEYPKVKR